MMIVFSAGNMIFLCLFIFFSELVQSLYSFAKLEKDYFGSGNRKIRRNIFDHVNNYQSNAIQMNRGGGRPDPSTLRRN